MITFHRLLCFVFFCSHNFHSVSCFQHQNNAHPKTVMWYKMGCSWPMHNVTWYLYPYYDIGNPELYNWNIHLNSSRKEQEYHIVQHAVMAKPTIGMHMCLKKMLFQLLRLWSWVHGPESMLSGGNTSSNPHALVLIPRPASNGMERMCLRHGSN